MKSEQNNLLPYINPKQAVAYHKISQKRSIVFIAVVSASSMFRNHGLTMVLVHRRSQRMAAEYRCPPNSPGLKYQANLLGLWVLDAVAQLVHCCFLHQYCTTKCHIQTKTPSPDSHGSQVFNIPYTYNLYLSAAYPDISNNLIKSYVMWKIKFANYNSLLIRTSCEMK